MITLFVRTSDNSIRSTVEPVCLTDPPGGQYSVHIEFNQSDIVYPMWFNPVTQQVQKEAP